MAAQYCTFRLDGHLFGVPVETVQEVLRHQSMTVVPLAPAEVSGLLNLRGQIVVTVDLRVRLGLQRRSAEAPSVNVVVRTHEGTVSLGESAGIQPLYSEIRVAQYRRSFALGRDLDANRIEASIRDGVLTLRVPKSEQAKPRRIEVKAS